MSPTDPSRILKLRRRLQYVRSGHIGRSLTNGLLVYLVSYSKNVVKTSMCVT